MPSLVTAPCFFEHLSTRAATPITLTLIMETTTVCHGKSPAVIREAKASDAEVAKQEMGRWRTIVCHGKSQGAAVDARRLLVDVRHE